jgi:hypothetical protein
MARKTPVKRGHADDREAERNARIDEIAERVSRIRRQATAPSHLTAVGRGQPAKPGRK